MVRSLSAVAHISQPGSPVLGHRRIDHYQKELGGVLALRNNDNNVARQVDIMERRIVKSQNQYMDTIARNNQLRTEVNIWRREILFLKKANSSIRADMKRLEDGNHALEQVRTVPSVGGGVQQVVAAICGLD